MAGENEYPSQQWRRPPQRSKVNTRPFWITVGVILGLAILIGVIAGVVGGSGDNEKQTAERTELEPTTTDYEYTPPVPSATVPPVTVPPTVMPAPPPPLPPSVTYDLTGPPLMLAASRATP